MKRVSNPCGRCQESISLLVSGVLSDAEKAEVENHLASCSKCRACFEEIKTVSMLLAHCKTEVAQIEPSRTAQTRWRNAIFAAAESSPALGSQSFLRELWHELLWPCRRAVVGMAAAWLVMWAVNSGILGSSAGMAGANSPQAPGSWQNLAEQRQVLAEVMKTQPPEPAETPRRSAPRPRGDIAPAVKTC